MKSILDNPFRIAGILSNSCAREVAQQKTKLIRYASIGRQHNSSYDFSYFGKIDRSEVSIKKAFSDIERNEEKVNKSLFWFLLANPFDETAINYLIKGELEKAIEIWEKVTKGKEVTLKNYSCFNNLGTLKLLGDTREEIKEGIEAKIKLIESESFNEFIYAVADQTYTIDSQKEIEKFVDDIFENFKGQYSSSDTLYFFSNCNGAAQKYLKQKFTEEPLQKIEIQIENNKSKRKANKSQSYEFGETLFQNTKNDLAALKSLLGENDLNYKMIADNLAKEIMQCGIDYFKEWEDTKDPSDEGIMLLNYAKSIAVNSQTIERINSNIEGMEEFKEKEITQAIILLKSVKDAFDNAYNEIIKMAKKQLGIYDEMEFLEVGGKRIAVPRIQPIHNPFETRTINYSAVEEAAKKSVNWEKVVELIHQVIPSNSIDKIKNTSNSAKINEYKTLVNFLLSKINYLYKNKVQYLKYWEVAQTTSRYSSNSSSRTTTNSTTHSSRNGELPEWVLWVGGIILFFIIIRACAG